VVDEALLEALGKPGSGRGTGIVYAPTRRQTEEESERLVAAGWKCAPYHAGLDGPVRDRAQSRFRDGSIELIVATNAFGMGIDRPDVRVVVHLAPPGSLEAYYQEVGRAGRDGADAIGVLCSSPSDLPRRRLLEAPTDGIAPDPARVQHRWQLFLELMRWVEGGTCRHDAILRYFGDEAETLSGCGRCDNCTALSEPNDAGAEETATAVRKALSAVARTHRRFGLQAAVKLLAGQPDPRLERSGLMATKTFGALAGRSEDWLMALLRRLVTAGWVDFTAGDRPMVLLTPAGKAVLFADGPVRLLLPPEAQVASRAKSGGTTKARARQAADQLGPKAGALFELLRARRLELARREKVPPYVIASDRTLRELAELEPRSAADLQRVYGIGPAKAERYGEEFLGVLREAERSGG
jgi:ATP-dependent DNA helicase RecQ